MASFATRIASSAFSAGITDGIGPKISSCVTVFGKGDTCAEAYQAGVRRWPALN